MKNRNLITILFIVAVVAAFGGYRFLQNKKPTSSISQTVNKPKVKIGIQTSPAMALIMTAKDSGCFDAEGIDVEIVPFTAGKFALQALLGGSLDYCVSGEVPIALATLQGNQLTVLSQVVKNTVNECRIVVRKDESAANGPVAYFKAKRRKLAASVGGGPEFFNYEFLKMHGISMADVDIVAQSPGDMPAALVSGSVDAIGIFDPFCYIAEKKMGAEGVTFSDNTGTLYSELYVLSIGEKQKEASKKTATAVLRALVKAGEVIKNHPEEAKAAVAKYTKLDTETIDGVWNSFVFEAALTPKLLEYWNAQAVWAKATGKAQSETKIPDYRSIIADETLRKIKPEAVTIPPK